MDNFYAIVSDPLSAICSCWSLAGEQISFSLFRSLFYRSSPKVARARSSVHELYMRPYNYVSYKMGGSGGGSQYKYQYKTLHPQYGAYKPSPYQTPTPQPVTATPFYHSSPSPAYHTSSPYHAPSVATYQAPTYRYQPYSYPTTPAPTLPQCTPPPTVSTCNDSLGSICAWGPPWAGTGKVSNVSMSEYLCMLKVLFMLKYTKRPFCICSDSAL